MATDRRRFLQLLGATSAAAAIPDSIARALTIPAHNRTRSIADVEHIVILMQENRSFDHYFGTMRGVRGFGDPRAVNLPSGDSVFHQPNGSGVVLPFRPDAPNLGAQFLEDLPHGWTDTQGAWNSGKYDQWIPFKGTTTMAYLTREDIPYHFALADAFTVCDAYYCSFMGSTDPNRYHMWTGWLGNDGQGGGPVLDNAEAGYDWHTYPERLEQAGIRWKIYQDKGEGLDAAHYWGWGPPYVGNYGDNSLLYFHQYQNAAPSSALYERALSGTEITRGGTLFDQLKADVQTGKLPQVSWIAAPEAYTEHPNWPTNYGAWYISQILDALTSNPDVWSRTAFFLMYDENDGFFDHMLPPTPPTARAQGLSTIDTTHELFAGSARYKPGPIGLGVRVPMLVMSPWSRGGYVNSQVFDHTSLIRFIEARFAGSDPRLIETNITSWRRAVAGDLTSAFNFRTPNEGRVRLPSTQGYAPTDSETHPDYKPVLPEVQELPVQEPGLRPARALPYELNVFAAPDASRNNLVLEFVNTGRAAAVFQVRPSEGSQGPWTYTVGARAKISDVWDLTSESQGAYDLAVHGPNGFLRAFKGRLSGHGAVNLDVRSSYLVSRCGIELALQNRGASACKVSIWDAYSERRITTVLRARGNLSRAFSLDRTFGWYDLTVEVDTEPGFLCQLAGHLETGRDSASDPAFGARG